MELGIDPSWLKTAEGGDMLSGRSIAAGSEPIAQAYAGHQFGNFVSQLGDGRAILLGEVVDRLGAATTFTTPSSACTVRLRPP